MSDAGENWKEEVSAKLVIRPGPGRASDEFAASLKDTTAVITE